jgi:hypothetical protein
MFHRSDPFLDVSCWLPRGLADDPPTAYRSGRSRFARTALHHHHSGTDHPRDIAATLAQKPETQASRHATPMSFSRLGESEIAVNISRLFL